MDVNGEVNRNSCCMTPLAQLSDSEFRQLRRIVYETAGLAIADSGRTLLSSRVRKRLQVLNLDSFRDYLRSLSGDHDGAELTALLDSVCTKETSFFRTLTHFEWFASEFLAEQTQAARGKANHPSLRIWSAACSTGEEAYSLAILLAQHQPRLSCLNIKLFASDLSSSAIEQAREGVYGIDSVSKLNPGNRRYFESFNSSMRVKDVIRSRVEFRVHNLMLPAPHRNLDCVFLRNVLIYFDESSRETALTSAVDAIRPGGYLVVGPSEGVIEVPDGLERVQSFLFRRC
jgi:chemotaxis protein methyltransferase CheR